MKGGGGYLDPLSKVWNAQVNGNQNKKAGGGGGGGGGDFCVWPRNYNPQKCGRVHVLRKGVYINSYSNFSFDFSVILVHIW
jgi:hypothetical protein